MTFARTLLVRVGLLTMLAAIFFAGSSPVAAQSEWVVHNFRQTGGDQPKGNLVADGAGNLYGTAFEDGTTIWGMVYELVRPVPPKTAWTETVLYDFSGEPDGALPEAGLVFDKAGNLYGTTNAGGSANNGTIFELSPPTSAGGKWTKAELHSFEGGVNDGASPQAGLVLDSTGNLYGATLGGGADEGGACFSRILAGCGTVFELSPPATPGGAWTQTILHSFNYGQGAFPKGTPILDAKGNLYGTTYEGGKFGDGVVYRVTRPATPGGAWTYRVLHAFQPMFGSSEGGYPSGALTLQIGRAHV